MKIREVGMVFILGLLLFLAILIVHRPEHSVIQDDLFNTQTLPEDELDALLLARGVDASIITYIPVWEKQYLIDCGVETVSFSDGSNHADDGWKESGVNQSSSDDFSMRIIFANFQKERAGEIYPCYRIIILYEWRKLPVWTGSDSLRLVYDDKVWTPWSDDVRQVDYVRKKGEVIKAVATKFLEVAKIGDLTWGIDIKRKPGNIVRDGYVAITLEGRKKLGEREEGDTGIQVRYMHDAMWTKYEVMVRRFLYEKDGDGYFSE